MNTFRTDRNNNPTAFTTDIAVQGGLVAGQDYEIGESFISDDGSIKQTLYTAKLLGDPVELTIKVINRLGFYDSKGSLRWSYIAIPYVLWVSLNLEQKEYVIGYMYKQEGGTAMKKLFPNLPS